MRHTRTLAATAVLTLTMSSCTLIGDDEPSASPSGSASSPDATPTEQVGGTSTGDDVAHETRGCSHDRGGR